MWIVGTLASLVLILLILMDAFEAIVLPRQVVRPFRFTRLFYRTTWSIWRSLGVRVPEKRRGGFLSWYGPLSMLMLFATWGIGLIVGFALLHWTHGTPLKDGGVPATTLPTYLYWSGVTFLTVGYGDVAPATTFGRLASVAEAGIGFGFIAVLIGYLPVLYQAFSRREVTISLLDARAGSPPSAAQFVVRLARSGNLAAIDSFLAEWERWSAELLESHLSFPVLSFYRSQHENQSWLACLTAILDTCAILIVGVKGINPYQVQLTFAMARHAAVDLAVIFNIPRVPPERDRLGADDLQRLRKMLQEAGLDLHEGPGLAAKLAELRAMYEPFVYALAWIFVYRLPPIVPEDGRTDNWQRSPGMQLAPAIGTLPQFAASDDHFA